MFTVVYSEAKNLNASHFHEQNTNYLIRISNAYIALYLKPGASGYLPVFTIYKIMV